MSLRIDAISYRLVLIHAPRLDNCELKLMLTVEYTCVRRSCCLLWMTLVFLIDVKPLTNIYGKLVKLRKFHCYHAVYATEVSLSCCWIGGGGKLLTISVILNKYYLINNNYLPVTNSEGGKSAPAKLLG